MQWIIYDISFIIIIFTILIKQPDYIVLSLHGWHLKKTSINIDIDKDGGVIFPVDIVLNNYGSLRELYS